MRACQCTFCRKHGAHNVTDRDGHLVVRARRDDLIRYQFGTRGCDFLLCRRCGVYVAAVVATNSTTSDATNSATRNSTSGATNSATSNSTSGATNSATSGATRDATTSAPTTSYVATVNARLFPLTQPPTPVEYDAESAAERRARRIANWTPTDLIVTD